MTDRQTDGRTDINGTDSFLSFFPKTGKKENAFLSLFLPSTIFYRNTTAKYVGILVGYLNGLKSTELLLLLLVLSILTADLLP